MKLSYTVIFFSCWHRLLRARRVDSWRVSPVTGQARALNTPVPADDCAPDIALSIRKRIPYGSKVVFPDRACTAVDTGPAVISRKAASSMRTNCEPTQGHRVDRFFETKREAMAWTNAHPHFMTLQVFPARISSRTIRAMINWK